MDKGDAISFGIYVVGYVILISGLVYAAHLMHLPHHWILAGGIVMAGIGVLSAVKSTQQKDPN